MNLGVGVMLMVILIQEKRNMGSLCHMEELLGRGEEGRL